MYWLLQNFLSVCHKMPKISGKKIMPSVYLRTFHIIYSDEKNVSLCTSVSAKRGCSTVQKKSIFRARYKFQQ